MYIVINDSLGSIIVRGVHSFAKEAEGQAIAERKLIRNKSDKVYKVTYTEFKCNLKYKDVRS
jgi:hypothetical protein